MKDNVFLIAYVGQYANIVEIEALEDDLGIYLPGDLNYPGGILFDPQNFSKDPVAFEELKVKEIKNCIMEAQLWLPRYVFMLRQL